MWVKWHGFLLLCFSLILPSLSQNYGNATYNRLPLVSQFHTEDFDVDTGNLVNSYMEEIITIPYTVGFWFFIMLVVFQISLCCRWCCDCCRCIKQSGTSRESLESFTKWARSIKNSRTRLIGSFFFLVTACFIFIPGFLVCRAYFAKGADEVLDASDVLYDLTIQLEDSGDDLVYLGDVVINTTLLAIPTCPEADIILNHTDSYLNSVADYNDIIDPIPGNLNDLRKFADDGTNRIDGGLWTLVSIYSLVCLINVISFCLRKRVMMRVSLGLGLFLLYCTLAIWIATTVMLMVLSDFCMRPTDNAVLVCPRNVEEIAYFYGTCNGTNPLYEPLSSAVDATTALGVTVTVLTQPNGSCPGNEYLLATYPSIANMLSNISYIEEATQCPPLQEEWANIFNEAFCDKTFIAIYTLFTTLSALLVALFALMITSSLISQYFDDYWETGNLVTQHGATMVNDSLLDSVEQLQPDGSVTLSSATLETKEPPIRYSEHMEAPPQGQWTAVISHPSSPVSSESSDVNSNNTLLEASRLADSSCFRITESDGDDRISAGSVHDDI